MEKIQLSENLWRHEFECSCGCGFDTVDIGLVALIQDVCDHFKCRVDLTSGARCFEYNRLPVDRGGPGSNDRSQHPLGRAGDCRFRDVSASDVYNYLCVTHAGRYGFGLYVDDDFVHIDCRNGPAARWEV